MKKVVLVCLLSFLYSCAAGPIYMATNQAESMKTSYDDAKLKKLYAENESLLKGIYLRLSSSNVNIYKEGIGLTILNDDKNEKLHYIMMNIRPSEIVFNESTTKPEQRFSSVIGTYFPKYLNYIKKEDLNRDDIEGLALGIYWPVRDLSQCNQYGGFIEYIHIYFTREDVFDLLDKRKTFVEVVNDSEVITSLNLQPAKSVRPSF
ncbi:MAG: hypothetical protein NT178_10140 [Proteobacteria bacterium]|nr:hypothetical protein [Pseudomonadota bacterium]